MQNKKILTTICIALVTLSSCFDKNEPKLLSELNDTAHKFVESQLFNGAIIIANDQINKIYVDGMKNPNQDKLDNDSQFMIASLTKQFTAAALLKALYLKYEQLYKPDQQEKVIQEVINALKAPISVFLDENHSIWQEDMPAWSNQVTLHNLLSHTSGIRDHINNQPKNEDHPNKTPAQIIAPVRKQALLFKPGSNFNYSNTNYFLLAHIVKHISGVEFSVFLQQNFFDKIGMKSTKNPIDGTVFNLRNRSNFREMAEEMSYNLVDNDTSLTANKNMLDIRLVQGAASIVSTAKDLHKWNVALHKDFQVLPKSLYQIMIKNYVSNFQESYGYGIIPSHSSKYGDIYTHAGYMRNYTSFMSYVKKDGISIILLSNVSKNTQQIAEKIGTLAKQSKYFNAKHKLRIDNATKIFYQKYPDPNNINILFRQWGNILFN